MFFRLSPYGRKIKTIIFAPRMRIANRILSGCVLLVLMCSALSSCEEEQTYAEQKKAERRVISAFVSKGTLQLDGELGDTLLYVKPIKEISEWQFAVQDSTTNIDDNEYVRLSSSGAYMQIVRKGTGKKLEDGDEERVLVRFVEYNISGDSIQSRNTNAYNIAMLDEMTVSNTSGILTGTFSQGLMKKLYSSSSVPEGWLIPLHYVNIGRQETEDGEIAKVRIIVPHSIGQANAVSSVYPCFYELTYMSSR